MRLSSRGPFTNMIVHFSAHISKWELVCKFGVIFHIFIISCLCSRFHVRNQWFFYSVITFSYIKCFVHSYTVDVVFTLSYRLTLIPTWISNHIPGKVWEEITYPFPNFNGATLSAPITAINGNIKVTTRTNVVKSITTVDDIKALLPDVDIGNLNWLQLPTVFIPYGIFLILYLIQNHWHIPLLIVCTCSILIHVSFPWDMPCGCPVAFITEPLADWL